jgi:hypothetical protein
MLVVEVRFFCFFPPRFAILVFAGTPVTQNFTRLMAQEFVHCAKQP